MDAAPPSIRRAEGLPPLCERDLPRLLGSDVSLKPAGKTAVQWKSLFTQAGMRLELDAEGALVASGLSAPHREECFAKLRHIAAKLDARVLDEKGADVTPPPPAPPPVPPSLPRRIGRAALFVLVLPASIAVMVLRVPVLLWKLWRVK